MKYTPCVIALCFCLLHGLPVQGAFNPFLEGPYGTDLIDREFQRSSTDGLDFFNVQVYAPNAEGTFPALYFLPGFQTLATVAAYSDILRQIASHGYTVIGAWVLIQDLSPDDRAHDFNQVIEWSKSTLTTMLYAGGAPEGFSIDFENSFLSGQSSGNHIALSHLVYEGCHDFKGLAMMSPVDGVDPFGLIDDFIIEVGVPVPVKIPSITIMAGLDPIKLNFLFPACAPEDMSNMRFYNALDSPRWFINATAFGHADCLNSMPIDTCPAGPQESRDLYHQFLAGTITAFMEVIRGDCDMRVHLEDPSQTIIDVEVLHDTPACEDISPYCINVPATTTASPK